MNDFKQKINQKDFSEFCKKWNVKELAVFGSLLTDDFDAESDIDILVEFKDDSRLGFFEMADMQDELEKFLGKKVDLVSKKGIQISKNYLRRNAILDSVKVLYAA
jgi:predicted nucleotidyltransferase